MKKLFLIFVLIFIGGIVMCETNSKRDILVVGHRGNAAYCPENTYISYLKAIELGTNIIETDIRLTKDGVVVFLHDENIDRTSNSVGNISEKTLAELKGYDFGYEDKFQDKFKGESILSLEEGLNLFKDKKVAFFLEIKTVEVIEPTIKLLKAKRIDKKKAMFLVWSLEDSKKIREYSKDYKIYHLAPIKEYLEAENKEEFFENMKKNGISGFSIDYNSLFSLNTNDLNVFLILSSKYKMPVGVWTLDATSQINKAISYKTYGKIGKKFYEGYISMITSNDPAKVIALTK